MQIQQGKKRSLTIILALIGTVTPLTGLHKFYLGQPLWGIIYFLLSWQSPMSRIACAIDAVLYLAQDQDQFNRHFNDYLEVIDLQKKELNPQEVTAIATAIRELEKLRQEGLISEAEFEEKRRQLIKSS